jgi:ribosomal protein S18 acetylase RimI-like enzyme
VSNRLSNSLNIESIRKNPSSAITVRKAVITDLDSMVKIAKICFPDRFILQSIYLSKKYWKVALESNSNEIWIWEINKQIAAFSLIITDLISWNQEKIKSNHYNLAIRLFALIMSPKFIFIKIKKKIWIFKYASGKRKQAKNIFIRNEINNPEVRLKPTNDQSLFYYGGIYSNPENLVWIEFVAVSPNYRQHGLALQIIRLNENRALTLGRKEIYGVIEAIITPWWMMHERLGYKRIHEGSNRYTYRKILK